MDNNNNRKGCDIIDNSEFLKEYKKYIEKDIIEFEKIIKKVFKNSSDIVIRNIIDDSSNISIVYIDGLINKDLLNRDIIKPLSLMKKGESIANAIQISQFKTIDISTDFLTDVGNGDVAIFCSAENKIYICDVKGWVQRAIETPDNETVVRGPKESFTETLRVNTSLIRRKIKNPNLVFEDVTLGKQTNTKIVVCYIDGIADPKVLEQLRQRMSNINADSILETGYIEQYIDDNPSLPLPTVGSTQKPDVAAAKLLEGRVVIICDGSPYVSTVPHLFIENLQSAEDYYHRPYLATFFRCIRIIALLISILLPGFYVAVVTYHSEMIPTVLLETIAGATAVIPFPKGAECFIMLFIFEILRESGTRLPRHIGSAVSIMGAIVIGEAAVNAGIVGAPMVIIISLTALASFVVPFLTEFMTIYRLLFLLVGTVMGLLGIVSLAIIMLTQLVAAESFGVPYMTLINANKKVRDFLIRYPLKAMKYRPNNIAKGNLRRQGV